MPKRVGSIERLPSGRWRARVNAGTRDDGSRRQLSATFDTEREADVWCHVTAERMGQHPEWQAGVTLSDLWDSYIPERGTALAKTTMDAYRWHMERRVLPGIGHLDVTEITHADIQRVLSGMTNGTARKARTALSSVLSYGVRIGLLSENVMRRADFDMPSDETPTDDSSWDDDPFGAIEGDLEVWDANTVLGCMELIRGLPLEPIWLMCVGGGLRVEEAFATRPMDCRRVMVSDTSVTQIAVHHATTRVEARKDTKTRGSRRIVTVLEPMGSRLWELAQAVGRDRPICAISASRQNKAWRSYFDAPTTSKHAKRRGNYRGRLRDLPYIPLSKMRNTHATLVQEAGVMDSVNAAMHGHSQKVSYAHYQRADTAGAAIEVSRHISLVG